jgi:hypothetical protein
MSSNSHGQDYEKATLHQNMDAFDKLPRDIRKAMAVSDNNWSAAHMLRARRAKRTRDKLKTIAQCIDVIRNGDIIKHRNDAERGLVMPGQR